jgi:hypothetical protein
MLRVNVGLSRKLSRDYNSTGFSVNLDGEITAPVSDPDAVIEQTRELFDLAEEALSLQIERHQSDTALASHDEEPQSHSTVGGRGNRPNGNGGSSVNRPTETARNQSDRPNGHGNGHEVEPATNKQIQFLLRLGQQQRMAKKQLESRVAEILGRHTDIYQLSKRDAGVVLDAMTAGSGRRS